MTPAFSGGQPVPFIAIENNGLIQAVIKFVIWIFEKGDIRLQPGRCSLTQAVKHNKPRAHIAAFGKIIQAVLPLVKFFYIGLQKIALGGI